MGEKYPITAEIENAAQITDIALKQTKTPSVTGGSKKRLQLLITDQREDILDRQDCITELHNNDLKILSFLQKDGGGYQYTFNGLARRLEIHQQSLARSLHRLIDLRLVEKLSDGYRLTKPDGAKSIQDNVHSEKASANNSGKKAYTQLVHAYLRTVPINEAIVHNLIGRRFGNLRWVGLMDDGSGYRLQWTGNDSSFQVVVNVTSRYLTIDTNANSNKNRVEATVGACRIFERIIIMIREMANGGAYILPLETSYTKELHTKNN